MYLTEQKIRRGDLPVLMKEAPRFNRNLATSREAPDASGRCRGGKPREF